MKKWLYMLLLALAAFLLPGKGTDVGELIPVELVRLTAGDGVFVAAADTGDFGTGATLEEAMADLTSSAPGKVFLETADYLLLAAQTRESWEKLEAWFRPGTLVYGVAVFVSCYHICLVPTVRGVCEACAQYAITYPYHELSVLCVCHFCLIHPESVH